MSPQIGTISCPGFTWCHQGNKLDSASTRPPSPLLLWTDSAPLPGLQGTALGEFCKAEVTPPFLCSKMGLWCRNRGMGPSPPGSSTQPPCSLLPNPTLHHFALNFSPLVEGDGHLHLSQTFVPIAPLTWVLDLSLTNTCSSFSIMNKYHILSRASHHFSKQSSLFQAAYAYFDHFLQCLKWHLNIFTQYV